MNTGQGPDWLGVCEVENRFVVDRTASHGQSKCLPEADPVRGMGKSVNQNGFSDHFPITMTVTEVD
jgi:hypothetical protein